MASAKRYKMTEAAQEARRRNSRKSRGAVTAQGRERIRAANLKHGYYSKERSQALEALGEDPKDLGALIAGAYEQYQPANALQSAMAERMARLHWRMLRAERLQESAVVRAIERVENRRAHTASNTRYLYGEIDSFQRMLRAAVARPDFHTPACFIPHCERVMRLTATAGLERTMELLWRLRRPQRFSDPPPEPLPEAMSDKLWEVAPTFYSDGDPSATPAEFPVAEGDERGPLREELWRMTDREIRIGEVSWGKLMDEAEEPLSQVERDRLAMTAEKQTGLMRREESACFREFWRTGSMLMKMQRELDPEDRGSTPGGEARPRAITKADRANLEEDSSAAREFVRGGAASHVEVVAAARVSTPTVAAAEGAPGTNAECRKSASKSAGDSENVDEKSREKAGILAARPGTLLGNDAEQPLQQGGV